MQLVQVDEADLSVDGTPTSLFAARELVMKQ
jgi:hypothetical protein